jgi:hypothetical protein
LAQSTIALDRQAKKVSYFEVKFSGTGACAVGLSPEVCDLTKYLGSLPE